MKLDERKIIIFNQSIDYYITGELLEIDYWVSAYTKSLYLSLFLSVSLFVGLSIEHLSFLKDTHQNIVKNFASIPKNIRKNTANFISMNNVLVLPYDKNTEERIMYLKENTNNYSVLAKIQMQLEIDNYKMIGQIQDQKQYIKDMMSIILSSMTYQKILQERFNILL